MRGSVLSAAALLALVATFASAARAPQCEGLLAKRGGGFFDKLSSKIDSVTKSGTDVSRGFVWVLASDWTHPDVCRFAPLPLRRRTRYCSATDETTALPTHRPSTRRPRPWTRASTRPPSRPLTPRYVHPLAGARVAVGRPGGLQER